MTLQVRFIIFQVLILLPFIAGYRAKNRFVHPDHASQRLARFNLVFLEPIIIFFSIWGLSITKELLVLPAAGLLIVITGFALGRLSMIPLKLRDAQGPTYCISSSLANHGSTMGGFICYLMLGEKGLGYAYIFSIYFMPYLILFIFPFARRSSPGASTESGLKGIVFNEKNMPLYAVLAALIFHSLNLKRPDVSPAVELLLMASIAVYYFSLGMNFTFSSPWSMGREIIALSAVKFVLIPGIVLTALSFPDIDASIKAVIVIQSFMPVAIYSVITSILFELDTPLASRLFVYNTILFLAIVLPSIVIFRGLIL